MPRISRFKLRNSDRSGFKFFEIGMVKDGPWTVSPEELDVPPPSKVSLGGEGDISGEARSGSDFATAGATDIPSYNDNPVVYVQAAVGISPSEAHPWMRVSGSGGAVTVTANPQIVVGREGQVLTLQCVDSAITLTNGNGVATAGSALLVLRSGAAATLVYTTGAAVWQEASRGP